MTECKQIRAVIKMNAPTLYCTSMAAMILEVYYRTLPLYSERAVKELACGGDITHELIPFKNWDDDVGHSRVTTKAIE